MANWITVAAANHVAIGRAKGFIQVNHGKSAPLNRMAPGDRVACYSPVQIYRTATRLQAFTALGIIGDRPPYQGDMGGGFTPFRRDVDWLDTHPAAIADLLAVLACTAGRTNWGYAFRFGLFKVGDPDMALIAAAMGRAELPPA